MNIARPFAARLLGAAVTVLAGTATLEAVLTGRERGADFATVSESERAAILGILRETLPDFAGRSG